MGERGDPLDAGDGIPYPLFARLRAEEPVSRTPSGIWFLAGYDDVLAATHAIDCFQASFREPGVVVPDEEQLINEIPEPRHGKIRRIVNSAIAAHRVSKVVDVARELSVTLLENAIGRGRVEAMEEIILPIPTSVIATLLGFPTGDFQRIGAWSTQVVQSDYPTRNRTERGEGLAGGHPEFTRYVDAQIARRRDAADPPQDFLTRLLRTEVDGVRLSDVETRTLVVFLLVAGNETTRNLIGNLLHVLASVPSAYHALREDPERIPIAVEESLRLDPPTAVLLRDCIRDTTVGGVAIRKGEKVAFGLASANRDERVFEDPDSFRLDRPDPRAHLAFGGGPHVCPGSAVARMEARVFLEALVERVAVLELAPDYRREKLPVFWQNGPQQLPVTLVA